MPSPSYIFCPVSPTVITEANGPATELLTSQIALVLTYITTNDYYSWVTYTFLPTAPTDPVLSAIQYMPSQTSHSKYQETTSHTRISTTETTRGQSEPSTILNTGAIVGVAVACAIFGAVFSAIITCLLLRRRQQYLAKPEGLLLRHNEGEKCLPAAPIAEKAQLHAFFLDEKSDEKIREELRSLGHLIQQHVEEHYHLHLVQCNTNILSLSLTRLGVDQSAPMTTHHLASLALNPTTRHVAIRHVIAKVAFTSVAMDGNPPISLLPLRVTPFNLIAPSEEHILGDLEDIQFALTKWRQLSAFLLHPDHSDRSPLVPSEDVSTQQAQELAIALNAFLAPFISEDREAKYEQENHLREVIVECATFGYLLFSQPSEFRFRFDNAEGQQKIVVCPGIDKISDKEGRRYPSAVQAIISPLVESACQT
ncbi:hypothetical protein F5X99DRAFT_417300 [Biscogniauxia marginata]|nr:hypothetical protein F5X99DRAFT_417300 [Biscogniauxia marginata]